jgi:hypothetical protein
VCERYAFEAATLLCSQTIELPVTFSLNPDSPKFSPGHELLSLETLAVRRGVEKLFTSKTHFIFNKKIS